ncbi:MAG TPA: cytochrome c biogenesis protein CcsA [Bacteroidota bacterium]|nr:cytochrome c biogenesis protein CcsA [Bacteroidota bacterium]
MKTLIFAVNILLPLAYAGTVWAYAKAFFKNSILAKKIKTPLLAVTILVHAAYLLARTVLFDHPPITTIFEIMSVIAFSIAFSYRVIEYVTNTRNTGYFILILPFIFQLISSVFIQDLTDVRSVLRSHLLGAHVVSAILGYSAFAISAVYGFLYLMLYHHIKSNRFGVVYENLPNLEKLEGLAITAVFSGFVLLTIAIFVGLIWLPRAFENFSYFDPKLVGTVIVWALYGTGLISKRAIGWQGRKIMILSIVAFTVSVFSMTVINIFFSGFHRFY